MTYFLPQVSLALLATCFILRCHFHDPATSEMPVWVRHVVFKWMAQILRFKIPKKRKPSVLNIIESETVSTQQNGATECIPNNRTMVDKVPRQRTSPPLLDKVFPSCNGINQPLVKQLSYSNLVNGNYKSGPTVPHQENRTFIPRLTVNQSEDWCIASSVASLSSNEGDQRHNCDSCADDELRASSYECRRVEELVKMQETLLAHVKILTNVVAENEQLQAKKDDWNTVASIFDQAFRITFLLIFFLSTLTIFYFFKS